jgi:nucleoside-diphosphate-sugar epimerase
MRRILLTGAAGFVGRQVTRALADAGAHITVVTRTGAAAPEFSHRHLELDDIFDLGQNEWAEICSDVESVIHVAWYAEPGQYLYSPLNLHCLAGTLRLAAGAAEAGVKRFTGIGTCFEYALGDSHDVLTTDSLLGPTTPYGAAKAAAWYGLSQYFSLTETEFAWCRLFYLYGPGEDERRLIPYLHNCFRGGVPAELTSGKQVRDFISVCEAGRQIARVGLGEGAGALNICSGVPMTVGGIALGIAERYGRPELVHLGVRADRADDPHYVVGQPSLTTETPESLDLITAIY